MVDFKAMPTVANSNMINAAYMLLETMKTGTPERQKQIVAEVWQTMAACSPPPRQGALTKIQRICLEIIADYINEHGLSPTYEEIGRQMNRERPAVHHIVKSMRKRGFITYREGQRRSIRILIQPGTKP